MKMNKYLGMAMMAAGVLAVASCTDYDDYNKVVADGTMPSANQTLWQNIRQNEQLTDFADLVDLSGFADDLDATQYYTVWAPLNGTYDRSQYEALNDKDLLKQFVKNHIASYAHHATGQLEEANRVLMLNEKSYAFTGATGDYMFDGIQVNTANIPSSNGLLHTISGAAVFYPNLYEYITDSTMTVGKNIDNLRRFFLERETVTLDKEASVEGPIVNGLQTYVDSVMVTENTLWNLLRAPIQREDSSYTFVIPTNDCWDKMYAKIRPNFNYIGSVVSRVYKTSGDYDDVSTTVAAKVTGDSLTNYYLTSNLIFSNTNAYNAWIEGEEMAPYGSDTLVSTARTKLSTGQDIINLTKERVRLSNGFARLTDTLAILPWETYLPERYVSPVQSSYPVISTGGRSISQTVRNPAPDVVDLSEQEDSTTYRYLWVKSDDGDRPTLTVYLPNMLSTTYDIYCIFVPEKVDTAAANSVTQPNRVIFDLNYCDENGELQTKTFLDERPENVDAFKAKYPRVTDGAEGSEYYNTIRAFSNDTSKVDTVFVGEFTFPICYYGLGTSSAPVCPSITIQSPLMTAGSVRRTVWEDFTADLRIAGFILKPKELAEYEETKMK